MPEPPYDPIEVFRRRLMAEGLSENSIENYVRDVSLFSEWLQDMGKDLMTATKEDVLDFLGHLRDEGQSSATIARRLSAIKSFWRLVRGEVLDVKWKGRERRLPVWLTEEEVDRLIDACETIKERAIVTLMYEAALRVSELCNLTVDDVDLRKGEVRVRGKGGKERVVPIGMRAIRALEVWLSVRPQDSPYLFPGRSPGEPIDRTTVFKMIKRLAQKAGIEKNITPHTLRHSRATLLRRKGMDIGELRVFLGHSDISTTVIYDHIVLEDIRRRLREIGEI